MKTRLIPLLTALSLILTPPVYGEDITLRPEVKVPELTGLPFSAEGATELQASPKGAELVRLAQYGDLAGNAYKNDAVRMTFEGAFKSYGNGRFNPAGTLRRQDVLTLLVRMQGQEAAVQQGVLAAAAGQSSEAVQSQLTQAYIAQAAASGILNADENNSLDLPATREEAAVWTARAINLQPDYGDVDGIFTYRDVQSVKPADRGLLEALLKERIFTTDANGNFNPGRTVRRDEMADILARISPRLYANRAMTAVSGMVAGVATETATEAGATITRRVYTLRTLDGAAVKVITETNSRTGIKTDFGVYKGGTVTGSSGLAVGDQVEIITRDNLAIFAEVLNDGTILSKLKADAMTGDGLRTYYGAVYDRIAETRQENGKTLNVDRIRLKNHTGQTFDIVVTTDPATGLKNDILVFRNGQTGGAALLQNGDFIEYMVKDPGILIYAQAQPQQVREVKGTVRETVVPETGTATLSVQDYSNAIGQYPVAAYADISVNTGYGKLSDLRYGMPVTVTLNNGLITRIAAETFVNPGYLDPANRMVMGTITAIDGTLVTVRGEDGATHAYTVEPQSQLVKSGEPVAFAALRTGDRVKLYFPELYTQTPSRIEIEGPEQLIQGIYSGRLVQVNPATGAVSLQNPLKLQNGQWIATGAYLQDFILKEDSQIYAFGKLRKLNDLKNYFLNNDVYLAVKDGYSQPQALQLVVKNGGERQVSSGIRTVDQALGRFELDNKTNVAFDAGTIFVRNDRLVEGSDLTDRDSAVVIANYLAGDTRAAVVSLSGTSQLRFGGLTVGYVDVVYSGRMDLEYYSQYTDNAMPEVETGESLPLYFGTGTRITDVTDEDAPESLTPYTFFQGEYSKEENEDTDNEGLDYERYYALAYSDGNGEVVDLLLRKNALFKGYDLDNTLEKESQLNDEMNDQLANLVVTKGTIATVDAKWNRLKLTDSMDWISYHQEWNVNRTDTYVEIGETLLVRNNKPITFDDLKPGDRIQVIRLKEDAVLVIVEE